MEYLEAKHLFIGNLHNRCYLAWLAPSSGFSEASITAA